MNSVSQGVYVIEHIVASISHLVIQAMLGFTQSHLVFEQTSIVAVISGTPLPPGLSKVFMYSTYYREIYVSVLWADIFSPIGMHQTAVLR